MTTTTETTTTNTVDNGEYTEEVTTVVTTTTKKAKKTKTKPVTHILVLLDASGSMVDCASEVVAGYNNFVKEQREVKSNDDVRMTLCLFDTRYKIKYKNLAIEDVPSLDYANYMSGMGGGTAYNDSFVRAMTDLENDLTEGKRKLSKKEGDGGDRVVFVTWTDGEENSSRQYPNQPEWVQDAVIKTCQFPGGVWMNPFPYGRFEKRIPAEVKNMKNRLDAAGWNFIFMGADLDSIKVAEIASSYGFSSGNTMSFEKANNGSANAMSFLSSSTACYRSSGAVKTSSLFTPDPEGDKVE